MIIRQQPIANVLAALACFAMLGVGAVHAQNVTDAQVQKAIDKAVKHIYDAQEAWGHWDLKEKGEGHVDGGQYGGKTALAVYALLSAGESYQHPKLQKAFDFLRKLEMEGTYAIGIRAHVWAKMPPEFMGLLSSDLQWLRLAYNEEKGTYDYSYPPRPSRVDLSVTQYGFMGVWEAAKRGLRVDQGFWKIQEDALLQRQNPDGGWTYGASGATRDSMTAAGLTLLYVTLDYLHSQDFHTPGRTANHPVIKSIEGGLEYFNKNFTGKENPYTLVGIERVGLASGVKYFGNKDWYATGAAHLVRSQAGNGGFGGGGHGGGIVNTAFSTVFLVRGSVPVAMNKLEIEGYEWNNRPRDVANLTRWLSDSTEREMNWQIVSTRLPAEEWLSAPILWLAGHKELEIDDAKKAKIKRFIDLGGTLVCNPDGGGSRAFAQSIENLAAEWYPNLKMDNISRDHPIFTALHTIPPTQRRGMRTVSNGARDMIILLERDWGLTFHSNKNMDSNPDWLLAANLFSLMANRGVLPNRLAAGLENREKGKAEDPITVGRAKYEGVWNPEPLVWERVGVRLFNRAGLDVVTTDIDLETLGDADVPLVHLAGTAKTELSEAQLKAIEDYTNKGGTILVETVGGRGDFARGVEEQLTKRFNRGAVPLGGDHRLLSGEGLAKGYNCSGVNYRRHAILTMRVLRRPRLAAFFQERRPAIIVSHEDLSLGVLDAKIWDILGYDSESAKRLMTNIVLTATRRSLAAAN